MRLAEENPKSDINVTPLVDVMLVILIIFMLVTPLLQKGMTVSLPTARNLHAIPDDPGRTATVVIKSGGDAYLNEKRIDLGSLTALLSDRRRSDAAVSLHIKADRSCSFGVVRQALRASRDAGFVDAAFLATPLEEPPPTVPGRNLPSPPREER